MRRLALLLTLLLAGCGSTYEARVRREITEPCSAEVRTQPLCVMNDGSIGYGIASGVE